MRLWSCALIVCLSTSAVAQTATAVQAAIPANQLVTAANGQTGQCMARTTSKHDGHDWTLVVPVPAANVADLSAKGFAPAACADMALNLGRFKATMCDLARGNDSVQAQTEAQLGVDARKLCTVAKVLVPDAAGTTPSG